MKTSIKPHKKKGEQLMSDISVITMPTFTTQPQVPLSSTTAKASIKTIKKETQVTLTQGGWLESSRGI